MAIQSNFGNIKPSLNLDFANTKKLDSRITFTRASTATYYDGVTTAKAEENLLLQSQTFNNIYWAQNNSTITADATTAPDGTSTADEMFETATTAVHRIAVDPAITSLTSTAYTLSVFAKENTRNWVALNLIRTAASNHRAWFDLNTGVVGTTDAGVTASITAVGNGWYRCSITKTTNAAETSMGVAIQIANADNTSSYAGDITKSVFLWGAQLEQRSSVTSYTATTTQAITNYIPVLLTAANNVPRFDHNPTTAESLGLLIEEQRTNTILQSEDLDTTWAETRATLNLNSVVSPGGTLTADRLIASTDNDTHFTTQTFTGTAASWTFTAYAKASGLNFVALRLFNGTSQVGLAYYNLSTGATGTVTAGTAAITAVGNGWYRCSLTATLAASASCTADIYLASADNTNSFAGNAFNGIALWGFQVELGAFPTSYIATGAATATRSADSASMTGTNFSSWYNQSEGSFYAEFATATPTTARILQIGDGTGNNRVDNFMAANQFAVFVQASGSTQVTGSATGILAANVFGKVSFAYKTNDFAWLLNAGAVSTDASGVVPTVYQIGIGRRLDSGTFLNGTIRRIAYYPLRLTNAQLQALTG